MPIVSLAVDNSAWVDSGITGPAQIKMEGGDDLALAVASILPTGEVTVTPHITLQKEGEFYYRGTDTIYFRTIASVLPGEVLNSKVLVVT